MHHKNTPSILQRRIPEKVFFGIFFRIKLMECKYCFGWKTEDRQTAVTSVPFAARKQLDLWIRGKIRIFVCYCFPNRPQLYIWVLWITLKDLIKTFKFFHIVNLITLSINKTLLLFYTYSRQTFFLKISKI